MLTDKSTKMSLFQLLGIILRCIEIHERKIVFFVVGIISTLRISVFHLLVLGVISIGLLSNRGFQRVSITVMNVLISTMIVGEMIYQMNYFSNKTTFNCTAALQSSQTYVFEDVSFYFDIFGFRKQDVVLLPAHCSIVILSTLLSINHILQEIWHADELPDGRKSNVVFPEVDHVVAEESVSQLLRFLFNYGFFKFGLEIVNICFAVILVIQHSICSILYVIFIFASVFLPRNIVSKMWTPFTIATATFLMLQYVFSLASTYSNCVGHLFDIHYILDWPISSVFTSTAITGDWCILFMMSRQRVVFGLEETFGENFPGGSNAPLSEDRVVPPAKEPDNRFGVAMVMKATFVALYWLSIGAAFVAGSSRAQIWPVAYLVGVFIVIWKGLNLFLAGRRYISTLINVFLTFSASMIIVKSATSWLGCHETPPHWLQLFMKMSEIECGDNELHLDVIVFGSLLFCKRFVSSKYFSTFVQNVKMMKMLRSRGAALVAKLQRKQVKSEENQWKRDMKKIKALVHRIRSLHVIGVQDEPTSHDEALLRGDYDMFQSDKSDLKFRRSTMTPAVDLTAESSSKTGQVLRVSRGTQVTLEETKNDEAPMSAIDAARNVRTSIDGIMMKIARFLNQFSRDFRLVEWDMKAEKAYLAGQLATSYTPRKLPDISKFIEFESTFYGKQQAPIIFLLDSIWDLIASQAELVCYMTIFFYQAFANSILTLPLPLMVLLWGYLTPVRPTATFWTTLIAYTEVIIVGKAIFQSNWFPWNNETELLFNPLNPPAVLGILKHQNYVLADIILLLIIYFHRQQLKMLGLWDEGVRQSVSTKRDSVMPDNESVPTTTATEGHPQKAMRLNSYEYLRPFIAFWEQITCGHWRLPKDVYIFVVWFDFINFIIVFFTFDSFSPGPSSDEGTIYIMSNDVPAPYLITVIIQFLVIIIDRILYLKKSVHGKLIFQIILVSLTHIWLFVALPFLTGRAFATMMWPRIWYLIRCVSFMLSAYQIRTGYPTRVHGHFLYRKFTQTYYVCHKIRQFIPFFNHIRSVLDWLFIPTSMTIRQWFRMECIFENAFECKCNQYSMEVYPWPRGKACPTSNKVLNGCAYLGGFFFLLWFPLILFAVFKAVAVPFPPHEVNLSIRINNFDSIYGNVIRENQITSDQALYDTLRYQYRSDQGAQYFLDRYDSRDLSVVWLDLESMTNWQISQPRFHYLIDSLANNSGPVSIFIVWEISRKRGSDVKTSSGVHPVQLNDVETKNLLSALTSNDSADISFSFPTIIEINEAEVRPAVKYSSTSGAFGYQNASLGLVKSKSEWWWELSQSCHENAFRRSTKNCQQVAVYVFSNKAYPFLTKFLSTKGIIGIYISFVFVMWTVIRRALANLHCFIMFTELPNVDPIFELCTSIYIAREREEFALEEDLFAKLQFLYRSPETMVEYTRKNSHQE